MKLKVIFKTITGSRLYGTHREDSDIDIRGVCFEPISTLFGIESFEQWENSESDETVWGLKKFVKLLIQNNPNILEVLFAPQEYVTVYHPYYYELHKERYNILWQGAYNRYVGYASAQYHKLTQKYSQGVFDRKHAGHCLRLLYQLYDLQGTGTFSPVLDPKRHADVFHVLRGDYSFEQFITCYDTLLTTVKTMPSVLPKEPDHTQLFFDMKLQYRRYVNAYW